MRNFFRKNRKNDNKQTWNPNELHVHKKEETERINTEYFNDLKTYPPYYKLGRVETERINTELYTERHIWVMEETERINTEVFGDPKTSLLHHQVERTEKIDVSYYKK